MRNEKGQFKKGYKPSLEFRIKLRKAQIGRIFPEDVRRRISESNKKTFKKKYPNGRPVWNKGKKTGQISWNKGKKLPPLSLEWRKKCSDAHKARREKSHLWKGGVTPTHHKIRNSFEYKIWRELVFKRDRYTCIFCKDDRGGNLEADHIKRFSEYPELRFDVQNGRTLCHDCHKKTKTYGRR